ncbi:OmpH family outer membrane protein [Compostibacter hankyongensis]|uniref:OmpH family outer membrane protein n=1 Tax=Compostibacter hankyongensis TaxID=1007089 RepID=A0ABP8FHG6_9BACT
MKNLSIALNVVLFVLVGILFYLHFSGPRSAAVPAGPRKAEAQNGTLKIAYVNIDSLEANYEYFKIKKGELEKQQASIERELNANAQALQKEVSDLQQKASTMTQSEGEAAQRSIVQKNRALQQKEQTLRQQFVEQQTRFNDELQKKLNDFLEQYNADKRYTYILSYSPGLSNILYKDEAYDITKEVIDGLNAASKNQK